MFLCQPLLEVLAGRFARSLILWHAVKIICFTFSEPPYLFHYALRSYYDEVLWPFIFRHLHSLLLTRCVFLCMTLAFSTVLAVISFYVIEQPFLKMKKRFETRASELQPDLVSVT